jgi:hypothetical protein
VEVLGGMVVRKSNCESNFEYGGSDGGEKEEKLQAWEVREEGR